jgi:hypothetical protein
MRPFIIVFITAVKSFGQHTPIVIKECQPADLQGRFTIVWVADKISFTGETFNVSKRGKFEYAVFDNNHQNGWDLVEEKIVTGKYYRDADTLKLKPKESPKSFGPEFFSYKQSYIIRGFGLTVYIDDNETTKQFVCLIPLDKIGDWENKLKELQNMLNQSFERQEDEGLLRLLNLNGQVQFFFGVERIFLMKIDWRVPAHNNVFMIMAGLIVDLKFTFLKFDLVTVKSFVFGRAKHFAALHFFARPISATP